MQLHVCVTKVSQPKCGLSSGKRLTDKRWGREPGLTDNENMRKRSTGQWSALLVILLVIAKIGQTADRGTYHTGAVLERDGGKLKGFEDLYLKPRQDFGLGHLKCSKFLRERHNQLRRWPLRERLCVRESVKESERVRDWVCVREWKNIKERGQEVSCQSREGLTGKDGFLEAVVLLVCLLFRRPKDVPVVGLWFRISGFRFRVWGFGFGLGFKGCRV